MGGAAIGNAALGVGGGAAVGGGGQAAGQPVSMNVQLQGGKNGVAAGAGAGGRGYGY